MSGGDLICVPYTLILHVHQICPIYIYVEAFFFVSGCFAVNKYPVYFKTRVQFSTICCLEIKTELGLFFYNVIIIIRNFILLRVW
jgi:hypothetical protein